MKPGTTTWYHTWSNSGLEESSIFYTAPLFISSGVEKEGKKLNRIHFYFKLTLCYVKAKLDLFEKDAAESQVCLESLSAPYTEPVEPMNSPGHKSSPTTPSTVWGTWVGQQLPCTVHGRLTPPQSAGDTEVAKNFQKILSYWKGWKNLDTKDRIRHKKNTTYNLLLLSNSVVTELLRYFSKSKVGASLFPCLVPMYVKKNHKIHTVLERKDILWL